LSSALHHPLNYFARVQCLQKYDLKYLVTTQRKNNGYISEALSCWRGLGEERLK